MAASEDFPSHDMSKVFSTEELMGFAALQDQIATEQQAADRARIISKSVTTIFEQAGAEIMHGPVSKLTWVAYEFCQDVEGTDETRELSVLLLTQSASDDLSIDSPDPPVMRLVQTELYSPEDTRQFLTTDVVLCGTNRTRYYVGALTVSGTYGSEYMADSIDGSDDPSEHAFHASYFAVSDKGTLHHHPAYPSQKFPFYKIDDSSIGKFAVPFGDWSVGSQLDALSVAQDILASVEDRNPVAVSRPRDTEY